jgi:hypothetical protein
MMTDQETVDKEFSQLKKLMEQKLSGQEILQ